MAHLARRIANCRSDRALPWATEILTPERLANLICHRHADPVTANGGQLSDLGIG